MFKKFKKTTIVKGARCSGLMVDAFDSRSSDQGLGYDQENCVVFLGKTYTLLTQCLSLSR